MNPSQHKILYLLREKGKEMSVGAIERRLNMKRSDVHYELTQLELKGYVTLKRGSNSSIIMMATATESGKEEFVSKAKASGPDVIAQLNELQNAISEIRQAIADIEIKTPEERKSIAERINNWMQVVQNAPVTIEAIQKVLNMVHL